MSEAPEPVPAGGEEFFRDEGGKSDLAFRTISEVSTEIDVPQHVLRFWESRFAQLKPLKRGGGRRYYRPEDIELLRRIKNYLYRQGYTIKGVQRLLRERPEPRPSFPPSYAAVAGVPPVIYSAASSVAMASTGVLEPVSRKESKEREIKDTGEKELAEAARLVQKSLDAVTLIHEELREAAPVTVQPVRKSVQKPESRKMAEEDISELRTILSDLMEMREVLRRAAPDAFDPYEDEAPRYDEAVAE